MDLTEFDEFFARVDEAKEIIEKYKEVDVILERIFLLENYLKTFGSVEKLLKHTRALEKQIYLQKKYLTIKETADYIAQTPNFVYNLTRKFELPYCKPGGKIIFIEVEEINKWIAKNRLMSYDEIKRNGMKRVIEMRSEREDAMSSLKPKKEKKKGRKKVIEDDLYEDKD